MRGVSEMAWQGEQAPQCLEGHASYPVKSCSQQIPRESF